MRGRGFKNKLNCLRWDIWYWFKRRILRRPPPVMDIAKLESLLTQIGKEWIRNDD